MDRLTERIDIDESEYGSGVWVKQHDYVGASVKLCEYEDLEELLINHTGCDLKDWIRKTTSLFDK